MQSVGYMSCACGDRDGYEPGLVLDSFAGSGTTLAVAARMGLRAIGIEISSAYNSAAQERIERAILERQHGAADADLIEAGQGLLL